MRRKTFDAIFTAGGAMLAIVLLAAGGLLMWGYSYANGTVHSQLAAQKIFFPPAAAFAHPKAGTEITPSMIPSVSQYAGQQLVNGAQAEVYANDFIGVHVTEIAGGLTYAQVSAKAMAQPTNAKLAGEKAALFQGQTLRGLLLNAYAFWEIGQVALWSSVGALVLGGAMLVLTALGLFHLRRVSPEAELVGLGLAKAA